LKKKNYIDKANVIPLLLKQLLGKQIEKINTPMKYDLREEETELIFIFI